MQVPSKIYTKNNSKLINVLSSYNTAVKLDNRRIQILDDVKFHNYIELKAHNKNAR